LRRTSGLGLALALFAGSTVANTLEVSPRPPVRAAGEVMVATANSLAPLHAPRPAPRPAAGPVLAAAIDAAVEALEVPRAPVTREAVTRSPRPAPRPAGLVRAVVVQPSVAALDDTAERAGRRGSVCGVNAIRGRRIAPIAGRIAGCGIAEPVEVTAVSGVELSQPATIDCATAKALNGWVRDSVIPVVGRTGGGVAGLKVIAHYSCRTRNSQRGAKISEHGKGHAVDIAGVILKNGETILVEEGWHDRRQSRIFKALHSAACGPFGTVLGPDADAYHQDHIHVDTARYRSGPYCR
jgi:hypothetical protein